MTREDVREIISTIQEDITANPSEFSSDPQQIRRFNAFINLAIATIQRATP